MYSRSNWRTDQDPVELGIKPFTIALGLFIRGLYGSRYSLCELGGRTMIAAMREVKVFVGIDLDVDEIVEALNEGDYPGDESTKLFEVAHALLSQHADDRAEIHQVEVTGAQVDGVQPSQLQVQFTTSWSARYGCRDMDTADDQEEDESVTYTADGHLIFTVPEPRRPANEC